MTIVGCCIRIEDLADAARERVDARVALEEEGGGRIELSVVRSVGISDNGGGGGVEILEVRREFDGESGGGGGISDDISESRDECTF